jgi:hypothetical protein
MREPTYLRVLALALMLVAPSFSASAQRGERGRFEDRFPLPNAPEEQTSPRNTPEGQTPLRTQTFGGHVYHGQLAWRDASKATKRELLIDRHLPAATLPPDSRPPHSVAPPPPSHGFRERPGLASIGIFRLSSTKSAASAL